MLLEQTVMFLYKKARAEVEAMLFVDLKPTRSYIVIGGIRMNNAIFSEGPLQNV